MPAMVASREVRTSMTVGAREMAFARDITDQVLFMDGCASGEHGPADDVLMRRGNPRTRAFLSRFHHATALRPAG
jgi:polar amino acid transport system ATP-binding protein